MEFANRCGWHKDSIKINLRALLFVTGWLGAEVSIHQADLEAVAAFGENWASRRVSHYPAQRSLLVPVERVDADEAAVNRLLAALPDQIREEAEIWVDVCRGRRRTPSITMRCSTIRHYAQAHAPVLQQWSQRMTSLREATPQDVETAVDERAGSRRHDTHCALRSLFRALKRERVTFRDPARKYSIPKVVTVPRRIPTDRLVGLLDRAPSAMANALVVLVAVHALGPETLRTTRLTGLDRAKGRRRVPHRSGGWHTVYLDDLTTVLLNNWLRERAERWPRSTNPHLFMTQMTALDPTAPPISPTAVKQVFAGLGVSADRLRIDRLLDEAHESEDPVHLMRVFGVSDTTAMKYVHTAHPELFIKAPTSP
ncbi:hypothetical protein [Kitasatospora sp. NPDC089509]|uniref:hypothetical protein n=1 Tax=Kitasatospora sp. NPDC089509 TaxID=3364079 RepID=UPI0037F19F34